MNASVAPKRRHGRPEIMLAMRGVGARLLLPADYAWGANNRDNFEAQRTTCLGHRTVSILPLTDTEDACCSFRLQLARVGDGWQDM